MFIAYPVDPCGYNASLGCITRPNRSALPMPTPPDEFELAEPIQMLLPDRAALTYLVENGWDLGHDVKETDDGVTVTVVATPSELAFLQSLGFVRLGTTFDQEAWEAFKAEREAELAEQAFTIEATDSVKILRADYWQSPRGEVLSIEAKSSAERDAVLTATWEPAPIFGVTCSQAIGLGNVPEDTAYWYSVRLSDPGTNSGSGHVTNRVWQGTLQGPVAFDVVIDWTITPSEGTTAEDSYYSWDSSEPGGEHPKGEGYFDCDEPLPTVPPSEHPLGLLWMLVNTSITIAPPEWKDARQDYITATWVAALLPIPRMGSRPKSMVIPDGLRRSLYGPHRAI
jgi:hypothetical protein